MVPELCSPGSPPEELLLDDELDDELELDGIEGMPAEVEEVDGIEGTEERELEDVLGSDGVDEDDDEDGDELGIDGADELDDEEGDELGMDGMPLLLELCWVDSQPDRTSASAEMPTQATARAERERSGSCCGFMMASVSIGGAADPEVPPGPLLGTRRVIL